MIRHTISWQDFIERVKTLATMQQLSYNIVNRFLGSHFTKEPNTRLESNSDLSYVDRVTLIRHDGIIVIDLSNSDQLNSWVQHALGCAEIEAIEPLSPSLDSNSNPPWERYVNHQVRLNGKKVYFGIKQLGGQDRLDAVSIWLGHTAEIQKTIRITGNAAACFKFIRGAIDDLKTLFQPKPSPPRAKNKTSRFDWLIKEAQQQGTIRGFRCVVANASGTISTRDFSELETACRYADDAASETDDRPPIAIVVDRSCRIVHEGRSYVQ